MYWMLCVYGYLCKARQAEFELWVQSLSVWFVVIIFPSLFGFGLAGLSEHQLRKKRLIKKTPQAGRKDQKMTQEPAAVKPENGRGTLALRHLVGPWRQSRTGYGV